MLLPQPCNLAAVLHQGDGGHAARDRDHDVGRLMLNEKRLALNENGDRVELADSRIERRYACDH
jgi:hypothetical protein